MQIDSKHLCYITGLLSRMRNYCGLKNTCVINRSFYTHDQGLSIKIVVVFSDNNDKKVRERECVRKSNRKDQTSKFAECLFQKISILLLCFANVFRNHRIHHVDERSL